MKARLAAITYYEWDSRVRNRASIHNPIADWKLRLPSGWDTLCSNRTIVEKPFRVRNSAGGCRPRAETRPPGLRPTAVIPAEPLMATQVLSSQVANGVANTDGVNGKAFKSKNQQRRAKLRAKKAEQKVQPVRRVRSPLPLIQQLRFLVLRAGRHASWEADPGV